MAPLIGGEGDLYRLGRRQPSLHGVENCRAQVGVSERLRRDRADARAHVGTARADRESAGRHRHGKGAGGRLVGNDRPGHFFSMFQSTTLVATRTPEMFLRNADGCRYWPRTTCVGYSEARSETASAMAFCLAGSVSLAKSSRSFSRPASHGQPKGALSQLALRKAAATGSSTSTEPHEVRYAPQPPLPGGSFLARRATSVCQSMACRSTLKPAFSRSDLATGARLDSEGMSVDCIGTTGVPS